MKQYKVTGMSCAACAARVEQAVSKVPGVSSCSVSLLTNSMGVEGLAADDDIVSAVENAGYHALPKNANENSGSSAGMEDEFADYEMPLLKKRLIYSGLILLILMYFTMGYSMFGFSIPSLLRENAAALGLFELLLCSVIMVINRKFFISGFRAALHLAPNMDTLVALGSMVSFLYSVWTLFAMMSAQMTAGIAAADTYKDSLYFESAAMILTLITVGKTLEARSKGKTTDALKSLIRLTPKKAAVIRDGAEQIVSIDQIRVNDIFVVRPGESIPVDGIIIEGDSAINESALTGESIPVDKKPGDEVNAATINQSGFLRCRAVRIGKDTALSQIIDMVRDAAATKAPIAKAADKVAGVFVPCVLLIACITFIIWMIIGETAGNALSYAIAVLVISCPCSLGLATPVAIMVGNGVGAKNGILFKTAASLETSGRIQVVVLDKTGTITKGEPKVTDIYTEKDISADHLLSTAYALEQKSEHPLAKAIVEKAKMENIELMDTSDATTIAGKGLQAKLKDKWVYGGNEAFIESKVDINDDIRKQASRFAEEGKTPLFFADSSRLLGIIAVADIIKEDARQAVKELKDMGIHVIMLTGDNERTASAIAIQAGVDEVISGVLPGGKEEAVRKIQSFGKTAMVGDGINDAPALTRADIGIAVGSGTDVAIDAADIVLMKSGLKNVPAAIRLGRATLRNIHENLFWAFFYNSIGIPVAAGALVNILGLKLNPMLAAAAMSLSSICVVTNALRLNIFEIYSARHDRKAKNVITSSILNDNAETLETEEKSMKKTMKIEGMMCPHCEARVKAALEGIEGVTQANVSYKSSTAVVTTDGNVTDEVLKETVENEKYKVLDIE